MGMGQSGPRKGHRTRSVLVCEYDALRP